MIVINQHRFSAQRRPDSVVSTGSPAPLERPEHADIRALLEPYGITEVLGILRERTWIAACKPAECYFIPLGKTLRVYDREIIAEAEQLAGISLLGIVLRLGLTCSLVSACIVSFLVPQLGLPLAVGTLLTLMFLSRILTSASILLQVKKHHRDGTLIKTLLPGHHAHETGTQIVISTPALPPELEDLVAKARLAGCDVYIALPANVIGYDWEAVVQAIQTSARARENRHIPIIGPLLGDPFICAIPRTEERNNRRVIILGHFGSTDNPQLDSLRRVLTEK